MRSFPLLLLICLQSLSTVFSSDPLEQISFTFWMDRQQGYVEWQELNTICSKHFIAVGAGTVEKFIDLKKEGDRKCNKLFWKLCSYSSTCHQESWDRQHIFYVFSCSKNERRCDRNLNCTLDSIHPLVGGAHRLTTFTIFLSCWSSKMVSTTSKPKPSKQPPKPKLALKQPLLTTPVPSKQSTKPMLSQSTSLRKLSHTTLQTSRKSSKMKQQQYRRTTAHHFTEWTQPPKKWISPSSKPTHMAYKKPATSANIDDDDYVEETHATSAPALPSAVCNNCDGHCLSTLAIAIILGPCVVLVLGFGMGIGFLIARIWPDKLKVLNVAQPLPPLMHPEISVATEFTDAQTETQPAESQIGTTTQANTTTTTAAKFTKVFETVYEDKVSPSSTTKVKPNRNRHSSHDVPIESILDIPGQTSPAVELSKDKTLLDN